MEEPLVSVFNFNYYFRALCGASVFLWATGYMLYHCLLGNFLYTVKVYSITAVLCGSDYLYYYFFSKSWKKITINETEIIVYDVIFKKSTVIPLTAITGINTYRERGPASSYGGAFSQDFVLEFNDDQILSFNEAWYKNYGKLTMAIYTQKYGAGHGRERYLQRHR